jgi:uncharacterized protein
MSTSNRDTSDKKKWWQYGYVWMIIGGPAIVVVASFITAYLAVTRPDPAIDDYYRKGMEINKTIDAENAAMAPALIARNHAQTGVPASK